MAIRQISKAIDFDKLALDLKQLGNAESGGGSSPKISGNSEFLDLLKKGIEEVNASSLSAEKSSQDIASGRSSNIHETMLAVTKAELSFNMMVQMRNKVIEAYQEVMRMQV